MSLEVSISSRSHLGDNTTPRSARHYLEIICELSIERSPVADSPILLVPSPSGEVVLGGPQRQKSSTELILFVQLDMAWGRVDLQRHSDMKRFGKRLSHIGLSLIVHLQMRQGGIRRSMSLCIGRTPRLESGARSLVRLVMS